MSDNQSNPPNAEELQDRLVDRGLRELLGGETPSDLSARILAAAGGQGVATTSTQTVGGEAMDGGEVKGGRAKSRLGWAQFAVAAMLLIGMGAAIWAYQVRDLELAHRTAAKASAPEPASGQPAVPAAAVAGEGKEHADFDSLIDTITSTVETPALHDDDASGRPAHQLYYGAQWSPIEDKGEGQEAAQNGIVAQGATREPLLQGAGVQVIAQREGRRYGLATAAPAAPGQEEPRSKNSANQDAPFRQSSFGLDAAPADAAGVEYQVQLQQLADDDDPLADLDATVGDHLWAMRTDRYAAASNPAKVESETDSLMMAVTPHILIQEEEELRLGFHHDNRDNYARIEENPFKSISAANTDNRLSTFSIDVDTASYANVRQFLMQSRTLPPADAVRIEELVNYFDYDYSAPTGDVPFDANVEVAACPWAPEHRLARIGIKGREMERSKRPQSNLVFLIDVSGSMDEPNKLPLLVEGMKLLTRELGENDRVAIVVYASTEGLVLESTPGTEQSTILRALDQLAAGGSTAGGAGIQLAYQIAADHFIKGGTNRVILCTDGDFNVGVTSPAELERMAEAKAKETGVFLTVLGFGRGNLNDAMMEQIADKGNGNYHYVDTRKEARKVLVEEMAGTLVTIAKDVKIQVEFNPAKVAGYRLIGYENRVLAAEDFNDDKKDAGEIGAGHTVTALYEIVPVGGKVAAAGVDELKYGAPEGAKPQAAEEEASDELLTLKIRYKAPDGDKSKKLEFPITDNGQSFAKASEDFKFASSVASFGMLLRGSQFKGNATFAAVAEIAEAAIGRDPHGYRAEFVEMVGRAKELSGE